LQQPFKYDPFGRRIYKSSSSGTSIYAYDGDQHAPELRLGRWLLRTLAASAPHSPSRLSPYATPPDKKEERIHACFEAVAAVIAMLLSGWTLLAYYGLRTTAQDRARGWEIYQLPSHPTLLMVAYLILGAALPFLSAWLMSPGQIDGTGEKAPTGVLWRSYLFRLGLSIVGCLLAALLIAFLTMAYSDSW
jgi:hypothetical protein